jgi:hypothetical protein
MNRFRICLYMGSNSVCLRSGPKFSSMANRGRCFGTIDARFLKRAGGKIRCAIVTCRIVEILQSGAAYVNAAAHGWKSRVMFPVIQRT